MGHFPYGKEIVKYVMEHPVDMNPFTVDVPLCENKSEVDYNGIFSSYFFFTIIFLIQVGLSCSRSLHFLQFVLKKVVVIGFCFPWIDLYLVNF